MAQNHLKETQRLTVVGLLFLDKLSDKIIYQYELKDMNLYLKCKTQIKKSNEENYLSGIFYIKPESMKFTL